MSDWFNSEPVGQATWKQRYNTNAYEQFIPLNSHMLHGLDNEAIIETLGSHSLYREILHKCAPLASVLYKRAEAFASGEVSVLNRRTGNDVRGINKEWQKLIDKPNWMQTKTEFLQQLHLFLDLYGWVYVLPIYPAGFTDRPKELWILPPECISVETLYKKAFYNYAEGDKLRKVRFTCNGESIELDESKLILFKDTKTPVNCDTWLPESRICSLRYPISKLISAEEAGVTLIQRKGAIGILSNESKDGIGSIPVDPTEKEQLQSNMAQYGLTRGQWQIIISSANLKWQSMAFNVKELMLHETYLQAVKDICEAYNYPFTLSSHTDMAHYNNLGTGDRQLIQNIIPEAKVIFEQYDNGVDAIENNIEIWCDYSKHPALQASIRENAEGLLAQNNAYKVLYDYNMITKNQWLEKIGENKIVDPDFDLYKYQTDSVIQENERADKNQKGQP